MLSDNHEIRPIDNRFNGKMGSHYDLKAIYRAALPIASLENIDKVSEIISR